MYSFDFKAKLRKLNDKLFVDDSKQTRIDSEHSASSIYCVDGKRKKQSTSYSHISSDIRRHMEADDAGAMGEFLCGVPLNWVPEHDVFNLQTGKMQARGWRSVLILLHKKGHISLDKARKIFQRAGLGLDEYDSLNFPTKLKWAKGYRFKDEPHYASKLVSFKR